MVQKITVNKANKLCLECSHIVNVDDTYIDEALNEAVPNNVRTVECAVNVPFIGKVVLKESFVAHPAGLNSHSSALKKE